MTLDTVDLTDHQAQLLEVLTREFEGAPLLDPANGAVLYQRLRSHLSAEGATEGDFEWTLERGQRSVTNSLSLAP